MQRISTRLMALIASVGLLGLTPIAPVAAQAEVSAEADGFSALAQSSITGDVSLSGPSGASPGDIVDFVIAAPIGAAAFEAVLDYDHTALEFGGLYPSDEQTTVQHGANLVVDHLVDLGHERIAHIDAGAAAGGPERRTGFINSMMGYGLAPIVVDGDFKEEAGFRAAAQLMTLRTPPTAIFAGNDLAAIGVLAHLQQIGARVPEDVSVVGYDDTLLAGISTVSLTTVHQPRQQLGRRAMELLLERIAGRTEARHELVQPRLVSRSSASRAPSNH